MEDINYAKPKVSYKKEKEKDSKKSKSKKSKPFQYEIIGTSHVSKESVETIKKRVQEFNPDLICVELDHTRLESLINKQNKKQRLSPKLIFQIGLWGYLFSLAGGYAQKKIGKQLNINPGEDMLSAVRIAGENNIKIALIDQHIQKTLKEISKNFKFKDKWNLFKDIIYGVTFPKKAMKTNLKMMGVKNLDLSKVPKDEIVEKMINILKIRYPGLHKAIVADRNVFMSNQIINIFKKDANKKLLIVVGAGHKDEMIKIINKRLKNIEIIN